MEAAEGLYQSISNQIGDAGESLKFTATAAKLARATNSSLTDSVDLLSGALKSYNLDASEAERISSVFFKTIDLGRVEAGELANSFGRVGSIAADLGLSLEEVTGALAAITIRGSKTSEALTQVRAITTALLKPSEAMAKTLQGLGFASGESAIKTLGLAVARPRKRSVRSVAAFIERFAVERGGWTRTAESPGRSSAEIEASRSSSFTVGTRVPSWSGRAWLS